MVFFKWLFIQVGHGQFKVIRWLCFALNLVEFELTVRFKVDGRGKGKGEGSLIFTNHPPPPVDIRTETAKTLRYCVTVHFLAHLNFTEATDVLLLSKVTNLVSLVRSSIPSLSWDSDWLRYPQHKEGIEELTEKQTQTLLANQSYMQGGDQGVHREVDQWSSWRRP